MTITSVPESELATATNSADPLHAWAVAPSAKLDAASLAAWADQRIAAQQAAVASLLSVQGARTIENTLRPFDEAANQLALASSQSHLLYAVGDTAELRDMGQALAQKISAIAAELSLDPKIYAALSELAASPGAANFDAPTTHYLQRTLLQYRLSGVDKDEATRNHLRALQDRATELSLSFGRHVQDDVRSVTVKDRAQLDGLPQDYSTATRPPPTATRPSPPTSPTTARSCASPKATPSAANFFSPTTTAPTRPTSGCCSTC